MKLMYAKYTYSNIKLHIVEDQHLLQKFLKYLVQVLAERIMSKLTSDLHGDQALYLQL